MIPFKILAKILDEIWEAKTKGPSVFAKSILKCLLESARWLSLAAKIGNMQLRPIEMIALAWDHSRYEPRQRPPKEDTDLNILLLYQGRFSFHTTLSFGRLSLSISQYLKFEFQNPSGRREWVPWFLTLATSDFLTMRFILCDVRYVRFLFLWFCVLGLSSWKIFFHFFEGDVAL